jgi:hypothetical protein
MNWRVIQFGGCLFFNLARDLAESLAAFSFLFILPFDSSISAMLGTNVKCVFQRRASFGDNRGRSKDKWFLPHTP